MTEPHHVALVHDGRVLVDETGALPSFLPDQHLGSLTQALRLVGAAIATAPVAKLPDGSRLQVVGSRGAPPTGTYIPPSALSDASLAAALLDCFRTPPSRPAWFLPGWFDLVEAWIDSVLAGSGRRRTHPIEAVKMWSISAVAKISTDGGDLWLKAPCKHFMSEAPVHATVAGLFPDLVPTLVAIEESQGWLLMEPMIGTEDDTRAPGAGLEVATQWAAAQISAVSHVDELVAGGCRRRGVSETVASFRSLLATSSELALLTAEELAAIQGCADSLAALVLEFWECGIPVTLSHGDLHLGNVAWDGTDLRIFDWTDGCVSHPFLDATHLAHFTRAVPGDAGLESTYAEQWRTAYPLADVDRTLALAPIVDSVFQAITFDDIVNSTEPMSRWELGGVVADILRTLPAKVAGVR